eukprot:scaffold22648_cov114-Cylindrotheca_fusiformis.AAC.5
MTDEKISHMHILPSSETPPQYDSNQETAPHALGVILYHQYPRKFTIRIQPSAKANADNLRFGSIKRLLHVSPSH